MHPVERSQTTRLYDGLRGDPRGRGERSIDPTQRGVGRSKPGA